MFLFGNVSSDEVILQKRFASFLHGVKKIQSSGLIKFWFQDDGAIGSKVETIFDEYSMIICKCKKLGMVSN